MQQLKHEVISRLLNAEVPKIIVATSEAKMSQVLRWSRELDEARETNQVQELLQMDEVVFDAIVQEIQDRSLPGVVEQTAEAIADIKVAKSKAEMLQISFQDSASVLNNRIKGLAGSTENVGELSMLADTLCALQTAFFNKNGTQVNVQNNYGDGKRVYSSFLGDAPQDA